MNSYMRDRIVHFVEEFNHSRTDIEFLDGTFFTSNARKMLQK